MKITLFTFLLGPVLVLILLIAYALTYEQRHPCVRTEPGMCRSSSPPGRWHPYPCEVCVERK